MNRRKSRKLVDIKPERVTVHSETVNLLRHICWETKRNAADTIHYALRLYAAALVTPIKARVPKVGRRLRGPEKLPIAAATRRLMRNSKEGF